MFASVVKGSIITKETQKQVRTASRNPTKYLNYIKRF